MSKEENEIAKDKEKKISQCQEMVEEKKRLVALARRSSRREFLVSLFDDFQLADARPRESVFPLVPDAEQLLGVLCVDFVDVRGIGILVLLNENRVADDDVDGSAVGHEADVIVEDSCNCC